MDTIERCETHVSLDFSPRGNLVDRALRTLHLCGFEGGGRGKLVTLFTSMLWKGILLLSQNRHFQRLMGLLFSHFTKWLTWTISLGFVNHEHRVFNITKIKTACGKGMKFIFFAQN